jgi:hypothetical protein
MKPEARLLLAAMALALVALVRAIEWAPPDLRLLRLWRLAGKSQPLTAGRWVKRQLLGCGTARLWLRARARRRDRSMRQALPGVVDRLCIGLGCGLTWRSALELAVQAPIDADICRLLERRALLAPDSLAALARSLRHEVDALECLLEWSRRHSIAAYDLRHEAVGDIHRVGGDWSDFLQRRVGTHHTGNARASSH